VQILVRISVVDQFFDVPNAWAEENIDDYDQSARVQLLIPTNPLLPLIARSVLGVKEW
jgi:hypothetical protein